MHHATDEATEVDDVDGGDEVFALSLVAEGTWVLQPGCLEQLVETALAQTVADT